MSGGTGRLTLRGRRLPSLGLGSGISAIIIKELRGRMRGRRAFVIITLHLLLLAVFGWMFMRLNEESASRFNSFSGDATFASAAVGRGVFVGLMFLQTLMVAVLAPAATAGAISSEREHQTLELLAVTPISSVAIVLGKLLSALAWVFVLILASIPVTALVFVFGGVAPDDVLRGYVVLFATVIGLGSIGIFFSTLTRRTGASTGLTFVATLALMIGSLFVWIFLSNTSEIGSTGFRRQPPEALLYLNPFVAQADVACGTEEGGFGDACGFMSNILDQGQGALPPDVVPVEPVPGKGVGIGGGGIEIDPIDVQGVPGIRRLPAPGGVVDDADVAIAAPDAFRDRFWPKSVAALLGLSVVLVLASVQLVTPTRRWHPSLPSYVRRRAARRDT